MKKIKLAIKTIISTIYPNKCICCGEIIDENLYICDSCNKSIERVNLNNICLDCGLEKENCSCKYNVYRFNALISVFKNIGNAQKVCYKFKFSKKQHYAKFFANEIANAVTKCYNAEDFDLICSVPSFNSLKYNHSGYLAREISRLLDIPFADTLLVCIKRTKQQHKSNIKERMSNVYGKYQAKYRIDNKRVLLIDDIKTTGATIDECTRVLLFAGAESVHCATVLGSHLIKK